MSKSIGEILQIFKLCCLYRFLTTLVTSQVSNNINPCNISWTIYNDSNFRNAYRASIQPTYPGCLEECEAISGCSAVDIDFRNSSNNFFTCWFHSNPNDSMFPFPGVHAYVKHVDCSKTSKSQGAQGPGGDTGPTGIPGFNGPPGFTGMPGMTGNAGIPGQKGPPGPTGYTGQNGMSGMYGIPGSSGQTGPVGASGPTGLPGATGPPAQYFTGNTGYWGTAINVYVNDACQPSWILYAGRHTSGALNSPVAVTTVERCKDVCLSFPNCAAIQFTSNSSTCGLHNHTNNLAFYNLSLVTNQYVLDDRCIKVGLSSSELSGSSGVAGPTGPQGSIGRQGETGSTGPTGMSGLPGASGPQGLIGMDGVPGNTGVTGFTGPTGDQGLPGPSASTAGATMVKTPSGDIIYIKDSCQTQWVNLSGYESPGATPEVTVTLDECKARCLAAPACVAIDYRLKRFSCRFHSNANNLNTKIQSVDNLQSVLLTKCSNITLFKRSVNKRNNDANNYDNDEEEDQSNCVQPEEDIWSKSEFYSVVITPPLTIFVNAVCYAVYMAGKKIFKRDFRPGMNLEKFYSIV